LKASTRARRIAWRAFRSALHAVERGSSVRSLVMAARPPRLQFDQVPRLGANGLVAKAVPGRAQYVVGSIAICARAIRPENYARDMSRVAKFECRRIGTQRDERSRSAAGLTGIVGARPNDYWDPARCHIVRRLQNNLPRADHG